MDLFDRSWFMLAGDVYATSAALYTLVTCLVCNDTETLSTVHQCGHSCDVIDTKTYVSLPYLSRSLDRKRESTASGLVGFTALAALPVYELLRIRHLFQSRFSLYIDVSFLPSVTTFVLRNIVVPVRMKPLQQMDIAGDSSQDDGTKEGQEDLLWSCMSRPMLALTPFEWDGVLL